MTGAAPVHVSRADGDEIVVAGADAATAATLAGLGFAERSGALVLAVGEQGETAAALAAPRDAGVRFARGREWAPAEVFEWLRERGAPCGPVPDDLVARPGAFEVREAELAGQW